MYLVTCLIRAVNEVQLSCVRLNTQLSASLCSNPENCKFSIQLLHVPTELPYVSRLDAQLPASLVSTPADCDFAIQLLHEPANPQAAAAQKGNAKGGKKGGKSGGKDLEVQNCE